jgi:hypothetical protein
MDLSCGVRGRAVGAILALVALVISACTRELPKESVTAAVTTTTSVSGDWDPRKRPDPCRLLSAREVAAAFGEPVGRPRWMHGWPPSCQFALEKPSGGLLYVADDSGPEARLNFERRKSSGVPVRPVAKVGEDAYWMPETATLHARAGSTRVFVTLQTDATLPADARRRLIALARVALGRALDRPVMDR